MLAGGLLAGSSLLAAEQTGGIKKVRDYFKNRENLKRLEQIEIEKKTLAGLITGGIKLADETEKAIIEFNGLVKKINAAGTSTEEFRAMEARIKQLGHFIKINRVKTGGMSTSPLTAASPYAEALLLNDSSLDSLAGLRISYRKNNALNIEFPYRHNHASAYLELGITSPETIDNKVSELKAYCGKNKTLMSSIAEIDLLYYILDENFDFALNAEKMGMMMDKEAPDWRERKANLYDDLKSNNELSALNIFELNRLKELMITLKAQSFRDSVFFQRDGDLAEPDTERGGIIPLPRNFHELVNINPEEKKADNAYIVPSNQEALWPAGLATYHFHATKLNNNDCGPSIGDAGSPFPK